MASIRVKKVESYIQKEIADIIRNEVKDPRVSPLAITITHVKVSNDLKVAKIYISIMGNDDVIDNTMDGINSAKGFIQSQIGKILKLRITPEIRFILDDSLKDGDRIIQKLRNLVTEEDDESNNS